MFDYLDKFNNLSDDIKMAVDSDEAVKAIEKIEQEYNVELASIVMRVVIKEINIESLPLIFFTELNLNQEKSEQLAKDLKNKIFSKIADYLGFKIDKSEIDLSTRKQSLLGRDDKEEKHGLLGRDDKAGEIREDVDNLNSEPYIKEQEILGNYLKDDHVDKVKNQANEIIKILNLKFNEDDKSKQFLDLLIKYLRGLKDKIEIRKIFSKSKEMGGFSLADQMISNVFMIAASLQKEEYEEVKSSSSVDRDVLDKINRLSHGVSYGKNELKMIEASEPENILPPLHPAVISNKKEVLVSNMPKSEPAVEKDLKQEEIKEIPAVEAPVITKPPIIAEVPAVPVVPVVPVVAKEIVNDKIVVDEKNKKAEGVFIPLNIPKKIADIDSATGKIKMSDVKKMKIMGPIDEIRYLDLVNFRRLAKEPKEALAKIGEKIKTLEGLDYGKMLEGIKAWRQSSIHKLYLKIFLNAGDRGVGVDQIISELKSYGKDYLSKEELDAILEFNKTLRF